MQKNFSLHTIKNVSDAWSVECLIIDRFDKRDLI